MVAGITRKGAASLLAALATLLASAASQASVWYGSWDPLFGQPFLTPGFSYNLGWGGGQGGTFVNVQVNAPCGPSPVGIISNAGPCAGTALVQSAKVGLYDYGPGPNPPPAPTFLETLVFTASNLTIDYLQYGADSKLKAINTALSDWQTDTGAGTSAEFALRFVINPTDCPLCDLSSFVDGLFPSLGSYTGPVLFARLPILDTDTCDEGLAYVCYKGDKYYRANVLEFPAVATYVPEPASLALIAGSLLAFGVVTRRRRALTN